MGPKGDGEGEGTMNGDDKGEKIKRGREAPGVYSTIRRGGMVTCKESASQRGGDKSLARRTKTSDGKTVVRSLF